MTEIMLGAVDKAEAIWLHIGRFEGDAAITRRENKTATIAYSYKSRPANGAKGSAEGVRFEVLSSSRSDLTGMVLLEVQFVAD